MLQTLALLSQTKAAQSAGLQSFQTPGLRPSARKPSLDEYVELGTELDEDNDRLAQSAGGTVDIYGSLSGIFAQQDRDKFKQAAVSPSQLDGVSSADDYLAFDDEGVLTPESLAASAASNSAEREIYGQIVRTAAPDFE